MELGVAAAEGGRGPENFGQVRGGPGEGAGAYQTLAESSPEARAPGPTISQAQSRGEAGLGLQHGLTHAPVPRHDAAAHMSGTRFSYAFSYRYFLGSSGRGGACAYIP
jgi:hypothetical protein